MFQWKTLLDTEITQRKSQQTCTLVKMSITDDLNYKYMFYLIWSIVICFIMLYVLKAR